MSQDELQMKIEWKSHFPFRQKSRVGTIYKIDFFFPKKGKLLMLQYR